MTSYLELFIKLAIIHKQELKYIQALTEHNFRIFITVYSSRGSMDITVHYSDVFALKNFGPILNFAVYIIINSMAIKLEVFNLG